MNKKEELSKALSYMYKAYVKVLKVNYIDGTYDILKVESGEKPKSDRAKINILAWAHEYLDNDQVEDVNIELNKLAYNLNYIQRYFDDHNELSVIYKRRINNSKDFHWVNLKIIKLDKKKAYLYVINMDNCIKNELEYVYRKDRSQFIDEETKFKNAKSLTKLVKSYNNRSVGMIYMKVYDGVIQDLCTIIRTTFADGYFRLNDQEFIIICNDLSKVKFKQHYKALVSKTNDEFDIEFNKLYKERYHDLGELVEKVKREDDTKF